MTIPNALSPSKKPQSGPATISTPSQPPEAGRSKSGPATGKRGSPCAACCGFLAGLILVGFLGAALVIYRNDWDLGWFTGFHEGDQILASRMDSHFSNVLCETYTVQAWSDSAKGASFYLTDGPAKISPGYRLVVVINNDKGLRSYQDATYAAFYLLPGSVIEATACNQLPTGVQGELLFIKGSNHFHQWKQAASCEECVTQRVRIPEGQDCEVVQSGMLARFAVEKADTYYVVTTRRYQWQNDVAFIADVTMTVTKTVYDVSQAKEKCLETDSCVFDLTYNADDDIIVEFPYEEFATEDPHNSFDTTCSLRMKFFLIVFLFVPGCLIVLLIIVSCVCCVHSDRRSRHPLQHKKAEVKAAFVTTDPLSQRETLPPI